MTTTTTYPRLPELAPRGAAEAAEQYGLRALLFITAERLTETVDTEGLELAAHCFRLAVCNRDLTTGGAERLAEVGRLISGAIRRRAALDLEAPGTAQAPAGGANADRPNLGPMAPLSPAPRPQAPPSAARRPALTPRPQPTPAWAPTVAPPVRLAPSRPVAAEELF